VSSDGRPASQRERECQAQREGALDQTETNGILSGRRPTMRAWIVTAIVALNIHAAPGQVYEVFKSAEIDTRLEKLQEPAIIYQGANFAIFLNARSGVAGALETDGKVDKLLSIRGGSGALVLGDRHYEFGAGDLISIPRETAHRLSASSRRIEYVEVRFFGKGIPSPNPIYRTPWALSASEIAATLANGPTQTMHDAPTFAVSYATYSGHWGDWEEHRYHGHIYFVKNGHAAADLGGQLQNAKEEGSDTMLGTGVTSARRYEIGPGDIVVIPRNTPHHMELIDERLGYVFVKVRDR
jgi:mannose-6-phosphate isomerase-like protein (cupin superfamily)